MAESRPDETGFDELMRRAVEGAEGEADEAGASPPPPWLPIASIGAMLAGVGVALAAVLLAGVGTGPAALEAGTAGAEAGPVETAEAPVAGEAPEPAPSGAAEPGVDEAWVTDVADRTGIPERALSAYALAAARTSLERPGCGLGWNTLAGIGFVESEHGGHGDSRIARNGRASPPIVGVALDGASTARIPDTDGGALDGDAVWDRAVGPMQFIPSTWADWGTDGNGDGIADPQHIDDAAQAAADYLCAIGGDLRDPGRWIAAIAAYNDTVEYNHRVAAAATRYAELATLE